MFNQNSITVIITTYNSSSYFEKAIESVLNQSIKVETIIIVSHYSNNFEDCDNIVVLDKGQLIASGSLTELKLSNKSFL